MCCRSSLIFFSFCLHFSSGPLCLADVIIDNFEEGAVAVSSVDGLVSHVETGLDPSNSLGRHRISTVWNVNDTGTILADLHTTAGDDSLVFTLDGVNIEGFGRWQSFMRDENGNSTSADLLAGGDTQFRISVSEVSAPIDLTLRVETTGDVGGSVNFSVMAPGDYFLNFADFANVSGFNSIGQIELFFQETNTSMMPAVIGFSEIAAVSAVPEPGSALLLTIGACAITWRRRNRVLMPCLACVSMAPYLTDKLRWTINRMHQ